MTPETEENSQIRYRGVIIAAIGLVIAGFLYVLSVGPMEYLYTRNVIGLETYLKLEETVYAPLLPWSRGHRCFPPPPPTYVPDTYALWKPPGVREYHLYLDWWRELAISHI